MVTKKSKKRRSTSNQERGGRVRNEAREEQPVLMRQPYPGAHRTFEDVLMAADEQSPAPEDMIPPIGRALGFDQPIRLQHHDGTEDADGSLPWLSHDKKFTPFATGNRKHAYAFTRVIKELKHDRGWGHICSGIRYTSVDSHNRTYRAPPLDELVCIKRLNKRVVDNYLFGRANASTSDALRHLDEKYLWRAIQVGSCENPYREMARSRQYGDNEHLLCAHEFLQDDHFVYLIYPHACNQGSNNFIYSLDQYVCTQDMTEETIQDFFRQILSILVYMEERGLAHRDLSPDQFIFLEPKKLVLTDLAMSVKIPVDENRQRTLIQGIGNFGTRPFQAPEIYHNYLWDGVYADVWSALLILYFMLTKDLLYREPDAEVDACYRFYVVVGGIDQSEITSDMTEVWNDVFVEDPDENDQTALIRQKRAQSKIPSSAIDLFIKVFKVNAKDRLTLGQVMQHEFVTRPINP